MFLTCELMLYQMFPIMFNLLIETAGSGDISSVKISLTLLMVFSLELNYSVDIRHCMQCEFKRRGGGAAICWISWWVTFSLSLHFKSFYWENILPEVMDLYVYVCYFFHWAMPRSREHTIKTAYLHNVDIQFFVYLANPWAFCPPPLITKKTSYKPVGWVRIQGLNQTMDLENNPNWSYRCWTTFSCKLDANL